LHWILLRRAPTRFDHQATTVIREFPCAVAIRFARCCVPDAATGDLARPTARSKKRCSRRSTTDRCSLRSKDTDSRSARNILRRPLTASNSLVCDASKSRAPYGALEEDILASLSLLPLHPLLASLVVVVAADSPAIRHTHPHHPPLLHLALDTHPRRRPSLPRHKQLLLCCCSCAIGDI
jgi:hypothetical protein